MDLPELNYPRIYERVYCEPLCITKARFDSIHSVLFPRLLRGVSGAADAIEPQAAAKGSGGSSSRPTQSGFGRRATKARPQTNEWGAITDDRLYTSPKEGVAVIPISGVLAKNASPFEEACGGATDVTPIGYALHQAMDSKEINTIVLDISSPGGSVQGIRELAATVRQATQIRGKTVFAFTDSQAASAAYWIGSQADEFIATPSATVGSIGTYLAWLDQTVAMQLQGLRLELFSAGEHKGMGLPGKPLSQKDRELLQSSVNQINGWFTGDVTAARPKVTDSTMQGQVFRGEDTVKTGLVDFLVNDWEEFMGELGK